MSRAYSPVDSNRVRRKAARQGVAISISPRRDPRAVDYGRVFLFDPKTNSIVAEYDTLEQCEASLDGE